MNIEDPREKEGRDFISEKIKDWMQGGSDDSAEDNAIWFAERMKESLEEQ